jgi:phage regulator Rha-like protein
MPKKSKLPILIDQIDEMIHPIRGVRVMLDRDLAKIYGVPTKVFNQAVKRNRQRFPDDFMFRLTKEEAKGLQVSRSQSVTSSQRKNLLRSQTVTSNRRGGSRYLPYAFTEYGALMAANILNSPRAVQMSIFVVRAFAKMRDALRGTPELAKKLAALEKKLTKRLDTHEAAIVEVLHEVMQILNPSPLPEPERKQIGFHP